VVWLAYTQGVARGRGETPVLTAAAGPERVAPPQGSGGNTVPYQGFKIYEQPAPPDDSNNAPAPAKPAATPAPVAEAPKPASPPVAAAPQPAPAPVAEVPKPAPPPASKSVAAASKPAPAPAKPVEAPAKAAAAAPPKSVAALIQQANSAPAAEAPKPAPAVKQALAPLGGPATGAPRQLGSANTAPAPAKAVAPVATPAVAKPAASGGYVLQIGAYKSQSDADAAWKVYKAKHSVLLSAYSDDIQQADLGEKGTWYRLRIAGFADKDMASSLCDRLKTDGGACILGH
jgi:hypothetical protein